MRYFVLVRQQDGTLAVFAQLNNLQNVAHAVNILTEGPGGYRDEDVIVVREVEL